MSGGSAHREANERAIPRSQAMTDLPSSSTSRTAAADSRWQERLQPVMVWMVIGLTIFFFVASLVQLAYLHEKIWQAPQVELEELTELRATSGEALTPELLMLALLETNALQRRYHQANVLLMSRVWARYLGFVTGMILALVGAVFILGKLSEEATELGATGPDVGFNLRSGSPGVILAVLGVVLMGATIVTHHEIETVDQPIYLMLGFTAEKPAVQSFSNPGASYDEAPHQPAETALF
jgi:hypothetical protein